MKKALEQPHPYNGPITVKQEPFRTAGELRGLTDKSSDDFIDASGKSGNNSPDQGLFPT